MKKYSKVTLTATALLASLAIGMSFTNEVHAGKSETTNSQKGVTYVGNIDVRFNEKQINSGYVIVDGEEPVFLDIHVMTFGDTKIPEGAVVNVEMNGTTVSAPIDAQGNAYTGLPLSIQKNTIYLVHISTSGFAGDAPQTITFVGSNKNYTDDIIIPEPEKPEIEVPEVEVPEVEVPEVEVPEVEVPEVEVPEVEVPEVEQPTANETKKEEIEKPVAESSLIEESTTQSERTTQSSVQPITETSETVSESQPATQENEEIKELPKTGTKQSKFLKALGIFLVGLALGNLLFIFRKGGK